MRLRSRLVAGLVAAALVTVTSGCGEYTSNRDAGEGITLTWWDYFSYSPTANRAVETLLDKYEAAHPGIKVTRTAIGFGDFRPKLIQAAASGEFPDVAAIDNADVPMFVHHGVLADLTARMQLWQGGITFLDAVQRSVQVRDKAYGIPFRSNTTALWYNKNLFAEAGLDKPPATWAELRDHAKKLTTDKHAGMCFAATPNEQGAFTLLPLIWQAGGDIPTIGDQASIDALSLVNALVNEDKSAPKSVLQWGQSEIGDQFAAGQCAMMINGPWVLPTVTKGGFDFGVAPWPAGSRGSASPLGGEVLAVGKRTKHLDAAWELTTWLANPDNSLAELSKGLGGLPNRTNTIDDPAWIWHPVVAAFAEQMRAARPRGVYGARYHQISHLITTMEHQVLAQGRTPAEAAGEASERIRQLLKRER